MSFDTDLLGLLVPLWPEGAQRVIFANQNGPQPKKPFLTLMITVGKPLPRHELPVEVNPGDATQLQRRIASPRPITAQLQGYGVGAMGFMDNLAMRLKTDDWIDAAGAKNIALSDQSEIQNVPNLVDQAAYEERAILQLELTYTGVITVPAYVIETVEGDFSQTPAGPLDPQPFIATVHVTENP